MPLGTSLLIIGAAAAVGGVLRKTFKELCGAGTHDWCDDDYRKDEQRSLGREHIVSTPKHPQGTGLNRTYGSIGTRQYVAEHQPRRVEAMQPPAARPAISKTPAQLPQEVASETTQENCMCSDSEDDKLRTKPKTKANRRSKLRKLYNAGRRLQALIDLRVAISNPDLNSAERGGEREELLKRKAVIDLRNRRKAAKSLWEEITESGGQHDRKALSNIIKCLDEQIISRDEKAAKEIYTHHNPTCFDSAGNKIPNLLCDLHGLYVTEARKYAQSFIETCIKDGLPEVRIVTGKGIHSEGGEAKLKPAILEFLKAHPEVEEAKIDARNAGCILAHLKLTQSEITL